MKTGTQQSKRGEKRIKREFFWERDSPISKIRNKNALVLNRSFYSVEYLEVKFSLS